LEQLLRNALNGDEQAHDRGDDSGLVRHAHNQASPDRPVTNFVSPAPARRAHPTADGCHVLHSGERAWR